MKGSLKLAAALFGTGFETGVENSEGLTLLLMVYQTTTIKLTDKVYEWSKFFLSDQKRGTMKSFDLKTMPITLYGDL